MQYIEDALQILSIDDRLSSDEKRAIRGALEEMEGWHQKAFRLSCRVTELEKRRDDLLRANNEEVERRRTAERERDSLQRGCSNGLLASGAVRMKLLYVAGPYRSPFGIWGIKQNIERSAMVARELWLAGYAVICPHLNTAFMDGVDTDHIFLAGDTEILCRCDGIVMLPGWEYSSGASDEREFALSSGIPVFYYEDSSYMARMKSHFQMKEVA